MKALSVWAEVAEELHRAVELHGEQDHLPDVIPGFSYMDDWSTWDGAVGITVGAKYKALCQVKDEEGVCAWADILLEEVAEAIDEAVDGDQDALRKELVQVAAVAVHWINVIDRRKT